MRALISFFAFIVALWFIYFLLGVFVVVEEIIIGIAFLGAFCVIFIPVFIWNIVTNSPTRSAEFKISTDPTTHRNLGGQNDELPNLPNELTWWRGAIYLESEIPTKVKNLQLKLKRGRYDAHDFKEVELHGAQDLHWQYYNFAIPSQVDFGKHKAEIIAITESDDHGSGEITLRG